MEYTIITGVFNFYDGIIKASPNKTINGTVNDQADGYEIIKTIDENNTIETAVLDLLPIAEIVSTGNKYNTIQEAVDNCVSNTNETVKLLRNSLVIETANSVQIPEDKDIVFDINGYELSAGNKDTFVNKGKLEIIDSSEGEIGLLKNTNASLFRNEGNGSIVFTSGNISTTVKNYIGEDNKTIDCYVVTNSGSGAITVNGSNITGMYGILNESNGEVKILQGEVRGNNDIAIKNIGEGKVTIEGGSIYGSLNAIRNTIGEVHIKNGTITSNTVSIYSSGEGKVFISGGKIYNGQTSQVYIGDGYLEVSGGTIENQRGIEATGTAKVVITGGTIDCLRGILIHNGEASLKISNGIIKSKYEAIELMTGNMEITGGNITSTYNVTIKTYKNTNSNISNCTINLISENAKSCVENQGIMQITENTIINIQGENGDVITNTGDLTLGNNDGNVLDNTIMLNGGAVGIETKGTDNVFKYYDGTITAKDILKGEVYVPEGYSISSNSVDDKYVATLKPVENIVQIADKTYNSLQGAINECSENAEEPTIIKVIKPYVSTLTDLATIESGKNIILDLNGYKITNYGGMLNNKGKIQIIDSSEAKTAIITGYAHNLITNTGDLTLNANITQNRNYKFIENLNQGNVKIEGQNIVINNDNEYYRNCYVIYSTSTGNIEITGGDIVTDRQQYVQYYIIYSMNEETENKGNIIITGGHMHYSGTSGTVYGIYANQNANIKMTDGIIDATNAIYIYKNYNNNSNTIEITNGKLISENTTISTNKGTNLKVSGGEIITNATGGITSNTAINVCAGSTFEMSGGKITSNKVSGIMQTNGTTIITGGKIESLNCGIYISGGTLDILGGEIEVANGDGEQYGINIRNNSTVNLGMKEYPVSKLSPSIKSGKYGVYCDVNNAVFNFYDGIIEGKEKAIYGVVNDKPELYNVQLSNGETVATLGVSATFEKVAVMNGIYYNSLQTAIDSAGNTPSTIKIEKDNVISEPIIINEGQNITIDLYGNSIILPEGNYAIQNNGTLSIVDTLPEEEGENTISRVENYSGTAIQNNGTLTLGIDDGVEDNESPLIKGGITGEGTVIKYDGVIE